MKNFITLLFLCALVISCNSDDDTANPNQDLNGIWNLTFVSCECTPVDLEIGQHTWDIDLDTNTVVVQNNVTEEMHTIPDSGTYTISVTDTSFTIFEINFVYYFSEGNLILEDHPEIDGPRITFKRS